MKLEIPRKTWLRGEGSGASWLLRKEDGKMCCLGHYSLACGLTPNDIGAMKSPALVQRLRAEPPSACMTPLLEQRVDIWKGSSTCLEFMAVNDNYQIEDNDREARLTELFAEIGCDVTFTGRDHGSESNGSTQEIDHCGDQPL